MSDGLILGICTDCNHLFFEQPFPEVCPSCGSSKRPMPPDLAAERHAKRKAGESLPPLVIKPDESTHAYDRFWDGVQLLRRLIDDEVDALRAIETEIASAPGSKRLQMEHDGVEARVHSLMEAEKRISGLIMAEGEEAKNRGVDIHDIIGKKMDELIDSNTSQWAPLGNNEKPIGAVVSTNLDGTVNVALRGALAVGGLCPGCEKGVLEWKTNYMSDQEDLRCTECQTVHKKRDRQSAVERKDPF